MAALRSTQVCIARATMGLRRTRLAAYFQSLRITSQSKSQTVLISSRQFTSTRLNSLPDTTDSTIQSPPLSAPKSQPAREQLPYHVTRTHTNNLPVYVDIRSGGTRIETMIRKVDGDSSRLLKDVSKALGLDDVKATIKQPMGHVVFKGRHKEQIMEFLLKQGF